MCKYVNRINMDVKARSKKESYNFEDLEMGYKNKQNDISFWKEEFWLKISREREWNLSTCYSDTLKTKILYWGCLQMKRGVLDERE